VILKVVCQSHRDNHPVQGRLKACQSQKVNHPVQKRLLVVGSAASKIYGTMCGTVMDQANATSVEGFTVPLVVCSMLAAAKAGMPSCYGQSGKYPTDCKSAVAVKCHSPEGANGSTSCNVDSW